MLKGTLLEGKSGIIFGALDSQSIAWKVAEACHLQGAKLVLSNAPIALRLGKIYELSKICRQAPVIGADVSNNEDLLNLFQQAHDHFNGGFDFILHSVGMSMNIRKSNAYTALNHDFMHKTLDISAISFHRMLQILYNKQWMNEKGSILALTYIAAQRIFPDYNDMADAKALLESIARNFGYHFAKKAKVRVNTLSQSPTITTAGKGVKGFDGFIEYAQKMSPLGNANAEDCAKYCVLLFSDLAEKITMQNLYNDGGFSSTGVSQEVIKYFENQ